MIPHRAKKIGDPFSIMVYYIMVGIMDSLYHYMEIAYKHLNQHLVGFQLNNVQNPERRHFKKHFPAHGLWYTVIIMNIYIYINKGCIYVVQPHVINNQPIGVLNPVQFNIAMDTGPRGDDFHVILWSFSYLSCVNFVDNHLFKHVSILKKHSSPSNPGRFCAAHLGNCFSAIG